jgi:hypothetical protein
MNQELFDALVEEHLAVQQMLQEALANEGAPSDAAHERLAEAFASATLQLRKHSRPVPGTWSSAGEG